uniref:AB hydrolase-1 domain-containing protein n=1 Tax=Anopheles coluzzii TaxID=1518534 RepID=A0A6E8W3R9_ANOCL|nr:epoxide hydrolase 4-like [Anopheles coluzzii]
MDQLAFGCVRRAALVCVAFFLRLIRWLQVSYWVPNARPHPPDTLNHSKWGTHRYITVHNIKLHFVEQGSSSKPLMLFLHGLPDFWYSWRYQMHEFSKDYWTVALDLPGFGRSEPPAHSVTYKLSNLARLVCSLITALGKSECVLVGNGAGSILGWHIVNQYPDRVSRYVLLGMPSEAILQQLYQRGAIPLATLLKSAFLLYTGELPVLLARTDDYAMFNKLLGPDAKPQDLEAYKYTFAQPAALGHALTAFRENFADFFLEEYEYRVRKPANIPGLFLFQEEDCFGQTPEEYMGLLTDAYEPLETRFVARVGRFMHQDDPKTVNKLIGEFLGMNVTRPKRSLGDGPEKQVIVKEVCGNCHGNAHRKPAEAHHEKCVQNCDGQAHRYVFEKVRIPICS